MKEKVFVIGIIGFGLVIGSITLGMWVGKMENKRYDKVLKERKTISENLDEGKNIVPVPELSPKYIRFDTSEVVRFVDPDTGRLCYIYSRGGIWCVYGHYPLEK